MFHWDNYTIVRILIFLSIGILLNLKHQLNIPLSIIGIYLAISFLLFIAFGRKAYREEYNALLGATLFTGVLFLGNFITQQYQLHNQKEFFKTEEF